MMDDEKIWAAWQSGQIKSGTELTKALHRYSAAFAYHSGKIENDRIAYRDVEEIFERDSVTSYTGDLRTLLEIRNARDAHELFLSAFRDGRPLDEAFLLKLQFQLTKGTYTPLLWRLGERPGEYKRHHYVTGREEVGAAPEDVKAEMAELLEELREIPPKHSLIAATYFHAKFENIHPFADGNGRTGRLAMNYFLVLHNHPPVIVHEEDRKAYYEALEAWDSRQDLTPLKEFLLWQAEKTWGN